MNHPTNGRSILHANAARRTDECSSSRRDRAIDQLAASSLVALMLLITLLVTLSKFAEVATDPAIAEIAHAPLASTDAADGIIGRTGVRGIRQMRRAPPSAPAKLIIGGYGDSVRLITVDASAPPRWAQSAD